MTITSMMMMRTDALIDAVRSMDVADALVGCALLFAGYTIFEYAWYCMRKRRSGLAGPTVIVPFFGSLFEMVFDPERFWDKQRAFGSRSCNYLYVGDAGSGRYVVHLASAEESRRALDNKDGALRLFLHPNARTILGERNMAFMHGPDHKALRVELLPLFTKQALGSYLTIQRSHIVRAIDAWIREDRDRSTSNAPFLPIRNRVRDLNMSTSLEVFFGSYLNDQEMDECRGLYATMTEGFLAMPVCIPGWTALGNAVDARQRIVELFERAVSRSRKARDSADSHRRGLLGNWMATEGGSATRSNLQVAEAMLDFLFASQDASTSSLTWIVWMLAKRPDVRERVHDEQKYYWPERETEQQLDLEKLHNMRFTTAVVKEILRFRPPAPMVPHMVEAEEGYRLSDGVLVPKGTLLIPDLVASCRDGLPNADAFDPDRWTVVGKDRPTTANYLPFGCGPHMCMGYQYATNHLILFTALLCRSCHWTVQQTRDSDRIAYTPTISPADGCLARFSC